MTPETRDYLLNIVASLHRCDNYRTGRMTRAEKDALRPIQERRERAIEELTKVKVRP